MHHARDEDDGIGHLAPGELGDQGKCFFHRSRRVGGAEVERGLLLELDGIYRDDVLGADHARPLHGVDADTPDAHDDDRVTRLHLGPVHRRTPTGRDPA